MWGAAKGEALNEEQLNRKASLHIWVPIPLVQRNPSLISYGHGRICRFPFLRILLLSLAFGIRLVQELLDHGKC